MADSISPKVIPFDFNAELDYTFDWTAWLANRGNDTISTVAFTTAGPLTLTPVGSGHDSTTATVKVKVTTGTPSVAVDVPVTCSIVTTGGRKDDRTVTFQLRQR